MNNMLDRRARAHTRYRLMNGDIVPGVTTILGVLAKPNLITWANKKGLEGIDTTKYVDDSAIIGTAAHEMIECHLKGDGFDKNQYAPELLSDAENGFLKYLEWESVNTIANIQSEMKLVSEKYRYGGTIDLFCTLNGIPTLVDFKTSAKGIFPEMRHQVVAYHNLLTENGYECARRLILRIGRSDQLDFEVAEIGNLTEHFEIFKACLKIYEMQKRLSNEGGNR